MLPSAVKKIFLIYYCTHWSTIILTINKSKNLWALGTYQFFCRAMISPAMISPVFSLPVCDCIVPVTKYIVQLISTFHYSIDKCSCNLFVSNHAIEESENIVCNTCQEKEYLCTFGLKKDRHIFSWTLLLFNISLLLWGLEGCFGLL